MCLPDSERSLGVGESSQVEGEGHTPQGSPLAQGAWAVITLPDALMRWVALKLIRFYQVAISPWTPPSCIYTPTCSAYGYQAIAKYGFFKGGMLTAWRILRCNPWAQGGHDPVP